ncbi:MAG: tetratricopeptide repeat protein [SAR324 cluster bacterium]|nr:tetratricopeptide repeat protein [SAR324 cluster bacterium]
MNRINNRLTKILLVGLLLIFPVQSISAELVLDDEALYRYAMHLYRNGEYYRAVTEYKRLLHFFPESQRANEAALQMGRSHMAGGQLEEALEYWKKQLDLTPADGSQQNRLKMLYGISLLDLDITKTFSLRRRNIESAITVFADLKEMDEEGRLIHGFTHEWSTRPTPEFKSPWLAGSLSALLPGSGSFYSGRYIEGTYAFFITTLFWLATADAVANENGALTGLFGFFTLTFYGGNIYTAVNSVHKYNDQLGSKELQELRRKYGIWFIPETEHRKGHF